MGDNRPPVYYEDGVLVIRASAIGSTCMWELIAAGQGYKLQPVPDTLQRAFDEGNELEPVIIEKLKGMGWVFESHQEEGELRILPDLLIRYHSDGLASNNGPLTRAVIEAKALSHDLWLRGVRGSVGDVFEEYKWQLSVMMYGEGLPGVWAALNKGTPPINDMGDRELCVDEGKLHIERVAKPIIPLADLTVRALQIKEGVEGEDILETGRPCDDPTHWPCRFQHLRPEVEDTMDKDGKDVVEVPEGSRDEVDRLVREYLHFKGVADEANQRRDNAKSALIEIAGDRKVKLLTDKWLVPVLEGTNTSGYDWAAMPQELKEELKRYRKATKYRYLKGIKRQD